MHNFRTFSKIIGIEKRAVFLRRTGYEKPVHKLHEHQAERSSEAVRVEHLPHEVFHGLNITDDQALEYDRLGIREKLGRDMERWHGGRPAGSQILDERVTQKLKNICARETSVRLQETNWLFRNVRKAIGFVRNVRAIPYREHADDVGQVFEDIYDRNQGVGGFIQRWILRYDRLPLPILGDGPLTVDRIRANLARDIWNGLDAAGQAALTTLPTARAICRIPAGPIAPAAVLAALADQQTTPDQLEQLRTEAIAAGVAGLGNANVAPLFPASERRPSPTLYDRLIQMKQVEGDEKKRLQGKTVYDATRLQNFMDRELRQQPRIFNLVNDILIENSLYPIENNPDAQAFIAYVEYRLANDPLEEFTDTNPPPPPATLTTRQPRLRRDLEQISENTPSQEDKPDDKEKSDVQQRIENIQNLTANIQEKYKSLKDEYAQAGPLGNRLYDLRVQLLAMPAPSATAGGNVSDNARQNVTNQINEIQNSVTKLQTSISKNESEYRDSRNELLSTLRAVEPAIPPSLTNLNTFATIPTTFANTNPVNLFGQTNPAVATPPFPAWTVPAVAPNSFQAHIITDFDTFQMKEMGNEIKNHYNKAIKKKKPEKLTCRQLIFALKDRDLFRQGITNPELRRKDAFLATNMMIVDVKNTPFYESCNEQLGERLGGSILSFRVLARLRKVIAAYSGSRKHMLGEDVLAITTGMSDKLGAFRSLRRDSTISEIRELITANGGIGENELFEFSEQLKEVMIGFSMLKREGKISLFDRHAVQLEQLVTQLQLVQQEMHSLRFIRDVRTGTGNMGHVALKKVKDDEVAQAQVEKEVGERITKFDADWKQLFSKRNFENKYKAKYREARKFAKDNKMTRGETEDYLKSQSLLAADDEFSTSETARDAWLRAKDNINQAYEGAKTSKITASALKAGEWTLNHPVKAVTYDAPKWILTSAWGLGTYPFRLIGALGKDIGKIGKKKDKGGEKSDEKEKAKDKEKPQEKEKKAK